MVAAVVSMPDATSIVVDVAPVVLLRNIGEGEVEEEEEREGEGAGGGGERREVRGVDKGEDVGEGTRQEERYKFGTEEKPEEEAATGEVMRTGSSFAKT